jgi:hypothetical protein
MIGSEGGYCCASAFEKMKPPGRSKPGGFREI